MSTSRDAGATQQAGSNGITNLSKTFDERQESVQGSDDSAPGSKRSKVDCDYDDVHIWWITLKIGEMNEVVNRIDTAIDLVMKLLYGSNNIDNITIEYNLIDLLKESREILDSAKDDMRAEGGRDREATE
ncbi:uncharacterized protein RAG0_07836 [Rhynchosporium agropyri]|uniref:Uncharacterized protein n=1 Tax=Rhynchosporium agropyri TaxID=914238 RepID=A0A1E1KNA6_9HELO|nr:uncharacterized protein RAG0_07836 [Rhynchosporium agropyri]